MAREALWRRTSGHRTLPHEPPRSSPSGGPPSRVCPLNSWVQLSASAIDGDESVGAIGPVFDESANLPLAGGNDTGRVDDRIFAGVEREKVIHPSEDNAPENRSCRERVRREHDVTDPFLNPFGEQLSRRRAIRGSAKRVQRLDLPFFRLAGRGVSWATPLRLICRPAAVRARMPRPGGESEGSHCFAARVRTILVIASATDLRSANL